MWAWQDLEMNVPYVANLTRPSSCDRLSFLLHPRHVELNSRDQDSKRGKAWEDNRQSHSSKWLGKNDFMFISSSIS